MNSDSFQAGTPFDLIPFDLRDWFLDVYRRDAPVESALVENELANLISSIIS